jgi:signal transduction histidine kinase
VKGSNNDGYWNEEGASFRISIAEPPWTSWWATLLYILFTVSVIAAIIWYYFKRQQLRHALEIEHLQKEQLVNMDKMKSRFFANISHEFRTPLTLILGPIEKLKTQTSDRKCLDDLNIMQRNAFRLRRLIDQLLSLSRIEAGQMKLHAREDNVVTFIKGYFQSFESAAKQKDIIWTFTSNSNDIPLYFDQDKMEKIMYNLLSNALKFTPEGGRVVVKVDSTPPPLPSPKLGEGVREGVVISISDTGPGIAPEHLPHIFDRFYQADDSDSRFQEGSGIGLALVKELVELHHGSITVHSEPGKGTTFVISLPAGREHLRPDEIAVIQPPPRPSPNLGEGEREGVQPGTRNPESGKRHPSSSWWKTTPTCAITSVDSWGIAMKFLNRRTAWMASRRPSVAFPTSF